MSYQLYINVENKFCSWHQSKTHANGPFCGGQLEQQASTPEVLIWYCLWRDGSDVSVAEMESSTRLPLSPVHCVTVQVNAKPNYWSKTISNDPIPHSPIQNWETGLEILLQVKCVQEERWELFYHMSMFWNYFDCCCHSSSSRGKVWKTNGSWWVERSSAVSEHQYAAIWAVHFLSRPKMTTCKVH